MSDFYLDHTYNIDNSKIYLKKGEKPPKGAQVHPGTRDPSARWYYRFTQKNNPMSDWGHAMFATRRDRVEGYGDNEWRYRGEESIPIGELKERILREWDNKSFRPVGYDNLSGEEVYNSFNPQDIVDSAEGYDDGGLNQWLYERVLEPSDIKAITFESGAIVFDEDLIKKDNNEVSNGWNHITGKPISSHDIRMIFINEFGKDVDLQVAVHKDSEFDKLYGGHNPELLGKVKGYMDEKEILHIPESNQKSLLHESIHKLCNSVNKSIGTAVDEGITSYIEHLLSEKYGIDVEDSYKELRSYAQKLILISGKSPDQFIKEYVASPDKARYISDSVIDHNADLLYGNQKDWYDEPLSREEFVKKMKISYVETLKENTLSSFDMVTDYFDSLEFKQSDNSETYEDLGYQWFSTKDLDKLHDAIYPEIQSDNYKRYLSEGEDPQGETVLTGPRKGRYILVNDGESVGEQKRIQHPPVTNGRVEILSHRDSFDENMIAESEDSAAVGTIKDIISERPSAFSSRAILWDEDKIAGAAQFTSDGGLSIPMIGLESLGSVRSGAATNLINIVHDWGKQTGAQKIYYVAKDPAHGKIAENLGFSKDDDLTEIHISSEGDGVPGVEVYSMPVMDVFKSKELKEDPLLPYNEGDFIREDIQYYFPPDFFNDMQVYRLHNYKQAENNGYTLENKVYDKQGKMMAASSGKKVFVFTSYGHDIANGEAYLKAKIPNRGLDPDFYDRFLSIATSSLYSTTSMEEVQDPLIRHLGSSSVPGIINKFRNCEDQANFIASRYAEYTEYSPEKVQSVAAQIRKEITDGTWKNEDSWINTHKDAKFKNVRVLDPIRFNAYEAEKQHKTMYGGITISLPDMFREKVETYDSVRSTYMPIGKPHVRLLISDVDAVTVNYRDTNNADILVPSSFGEMSKEDQDESLLKAWGELWHKSIINNPRVAENYPDLCNISSEEFSDYYGRMFKGGEKDDDIQKRVIEVVQSPRCYYADPKTLEFMRSLPEKYKGKIDIGDKINSIREQKEAELLPLKKRIDELYGVLNEKSLPEEQRKAAAQEFREVGLKYHEELDGATQELELQKIDANIAFKADIKEYLKSIRGDAPEIHPKVNGEEKPVRKTLRIATRAMNWLNEVSPYGEVVNTTSIDALPGGGRSNCRQTEGGSKISLFTDTLFRDLDSVTAHEFGHAIENYDPAVKGKMYEFLEARCANQPVVPLQTIAGLYESYDKDEFGRKDSFISTYCGKSYPDRSTEVLSMGLEYLYSDPYMFMTKDPEHFALIMDVLSERLS